MKAQHVNLALELREHLSVINKGIEPYVLEAREQNVPVSLLRDSLGHYVAKDLVIAKAQVLYAIAMLEAT